MFFVLVSGLFDAILLLLSPYLIKEENVSLPDWDGCTCIVSALKIRFRFKRHATNRCC